MGEKNKANLSWIWVPVVLLLIAELLFYTWSRVQCQNIIYQIARETSNSNRLINMQSSLKIELDHLRSPKRISKIAEETLGLTLPSQDQLQYISVD